MRLIISGIFLLSIHLANAATSCDISTIIKQTWPDAKPTAAGVITSNKQVISLSEDSPQSAICRIWPAHPELTLAAVPLMSQEQSDYDHNGDLELLVLDSTTLNIKQRLLLPQRMNDDAFRISSISLDTARWKVKPDQTAFGLHISRTGSSRVNPMSEDALSLYVIENNQLRTILKGILLEDSGGEWDGNCAGEFNDIKRTLAITSSSNKGYADIRVSEKSVTSTAYVGTNDECLSRDKPSKASWTLRYDGNQYIIPNKLAPLE